MIKLISFNVNGIRAIIQKDFESDMKLLDPDILCLQETKAQDNQVREALSNFKDYHLVSNSAERKGYSGTVILSKKKPLNIIYGIDIYEHDKEGRVITAEYDDFFVICVYVPNSGSELKRLDYRTTWDIDFLNFIKNLEKKKPVIICGDLNVAHRDIDLANPKANYNKQAGYTQKEIDGIDRMFNAGLVDTFRYLHHDKIKYSWWSYRAGARSRNIGWRIDYFIVSQSILNRVKTAEILNDILGSDHCPVLLELEK